MFSSGEGMGVISPIHVNFCLFFSLTQLFIFLFVFSFIYLLILICGSFTLGRLFDFISAHFLLIIALCFSLKNLFVEKFFKLIGKIIMKNMRILMLKRTYNVQ